jgi:hypothetical protein
VVVVVPVVAALVVAVVVPVVVVVVVVPVVAVVVPVVVVPVVVAFIAAVVVLPPSGLPLAPPPVPQLARTLTRRPTREAESSIERLFMVLPPRELVPGYPT